MTKQQKKKVNMVFTYLIIFIIGFAMLYPIIWMFFATFKDNKEIFGTMKLLPEHFSWDAYVQGWKGSGQYTFTTFYLNTFKLVVPTVLLTMFSTSIVSYGFARFKFPFKKILFMLNCH